VYGRKDTLLIGAYLKGTVNRRIERRRKQRINGPEDGGGGPNQGSVRVLKRARSPGLNADDSISRCIRSVLK
jgi:hypothetical protein